MHAILAAVRSADPGELVLSGCCFAVALACSAASWRAMLGGGIRFPDACARYGAGSLANTFLPGRAGDVIRLGLFGRVVPGGTLAVAGAVAAVGAARWVVLLPLGIPGAVDDGLPVGAVALAGLAVAPLLVAWLCARGGSRRAGALLAPLRVANRATFAALAIWVGGTLVARIAAASLAGGALGVPHPVAAALLVVPALELAGIVPLTPANVGVAGGAAAFAFHANGLAAGEAVAAGFALHGVETAVTRINLDADAAHRVTLLATADATGAPIADIDGSTWDPWAQRLLFTTENTAAPTYAATPDYPSTVTDVSGALGRGGYEGIQDDSDGNIWIVEDIGGSAKPGTTAKRPNSFIYRYVPAHPGDLQHGKLEALQVMNSAGQPIMFESQAAVNNPDQVALHSYGNVLHTKWLVIHDTATDGTAPFVAIDKAKAAHATPFKRPENGQFRPGSHFTQFFFDETGDTNATSPENDTAGGWGTIQKLTQSSPSANTGTITVFWVSDEKTAGLDNVTFLSRDAVTFVQDMGDGLHAQGNALDSGFVWNVNVDYSKPGAPYPLRWLAEGRDASATLDNGATPAGFGKNEGDNEITGVHVSDGDPGTDGILGAKIPKVFEGSKWRWFYTQQHGDNSTYEVQSTGSNDRFDDH
jgi:hypothetical protein